MIEQIQRLITSIAERVGIQGAAKESLGSPRVKKEAVVMKSSSCYIYLYAFMCALFFVFGGCCTQRMADEIISETPRLVDYVARSDSGATLFEDYKGERMFTYSYLTNNAGIKITSVFCGYPSDCSLVHRRLYQENGKIVRTESITGKDPMVLELEVYDLNTEECVHREWITQGVARQFLGEYCRQKGISTMGGSGESGSFTPNCSGNK